MSEKKGKKDIWCPRGKTVSRNFWHSLFLYLFLDLQEDYFSQATLHLDGPCDPELWPMGHEQK